MKNVKIKKITGALLAAIMVLGVGGTFIAKTSSSFKFVAKQESQVTAADFSAKIYEVGNEGSAVVLNNETVGDPVNLGFDLDVTDLLLDSSTSKTIRFVVENTGAVDQKVNISKAFAAATEASNDQALFDKLTFNIKDENFGNANEVVIPAGESKTFTVSLSVMPGTDVEGKQGADNEAINGKVNVGMDVVIVPSK